MNRVWLPTLIVLVVIVGLVTLFAGERVAVAPDNKDSKDGFIRVLSPIAGESISSPLSVSGEARGYWFFEASFPVRVLDGDGDELGVGVAQAQGEWMTEEFVPFEVSVEFRESTTLVGSVVFEKDNPTGLPEHDDELVIPITFKKI